MNRAHIHRFGDCVAISLPGMKDTIYMTPKNARALARKLREFATNCDQVPFTQSAMGNDWVNLDDTGYNGTRFKLHARPGDQEDGKTE
jgi:hypothetical protein